MNDFCRFLTGVLFLVLLLAGCSAVSKLKSSYGTKFRYSYGLTAPIRSSSLSFQDPDMSVLFRVDDAAIRFKLTNKSGGAMRIQWENASIVVKGRSYGARNTRTMYLANPVDHGNPTVIPGAYIVDMAMPAENIFFDGKEWRERDLLPTTDRDSEVMRKRILANVGSTVTLLLPVEVGEQVRQYNFQFTVSRVDTLSWERFRRPRRPLPPSQIAKVEMRGSDQITTAILIAGFLGFSAFLLTQKKAPPSE